MDGSNAETRKRPVHLSFWPSMWRCAGILPHLNLGDSAKSGVSGVIGSILAFLQLVLYIRVGELCRIYGHLKVDPRLQINARREIDIKVRGMFL
ncbi:hypothetical protein CPB83DRAFT_851645 [Crepidotus variabilis]|uniref:Uncharacterized protein n=1 Tax=Crepidotus variabilis TaxID=179855 RepID=A0A9P6EJ41_9AGAR|nr:hypothetical protein CPB83DRAFT_851645 [Crepidotus variabilis]